jgi:hypothetical protein
LSDITLNEFQACLADLFLQFHASLTHSCTFDREGTHSGVRLR